MILKTLPSFCVSQTSGQGSKRDPLRDPSREACFRPVGNGWPKRDPKSGPYFDSHLESSEGPGLESPGEPHNTELNPRGFKMGAQSEAPGSIRIDVSIPECPGAGGPWLYIDVE